MSIFRNFFGGGNDRQRFLYDEDEQDYAIDTAASQYIRYPQRTAYPTGAMPQSLPSHVTSTMDPLVDYREPARVMEPRQVPPARVMEPRQVPPARVAPRPMMAPEVRIDRNQMGPVPMVVGTNMPPELDHVHRVIDFRVPLCCEGCQDRIIKHFRYVRGVENVACDLNRHKVSVTGYAPPHEILRQMRKQFPRAEFWSPEPMVVPVKKNMPSKVTVIEPGVRNTPVTVVDETGARHPEVPVQHVHAGPPPRHAVHVH